MSIITTVLKVTGRAVSFKLEQDLLKDQLIRNMALEREALSKLSEISKRAETLIQENNHQTLEFDRLKEESDFHFAQLSELRSEIENIKEAIRL